MNFTSATLIPTKCLVQSGTAWALQPVWGLLTSSPNLPSVSRWLHFGPACTGRTGNLVAGTIID